MSRSTNRFVLIWGIYLFILFLHMCMFPACCFRQRTYMAQVYTTQGVTKCNNKWCKICDIIIEGKSYTFKNPETKFKINKDLNGNSKNVVYIIECSECREIYEGSTQVLNTRTSLHRSNIKIEETRKLNVSKHLYKCIFLFVWLVLWHINLWRLSNAKSIFM